MVAASVLLAVILAPSRTDAFYEKGTDVVAIISAKALAKITDSPYLWIVELYREGCGYCQLLTPEYEKAAGKLRKLVGVAAVDVEKNNQLASQLMQTYNFQVCPHRNIADFTCPY